MAKLTTSGLLRTSASNWARSDCTGADAPSGSLSLSAHPSDQRRGAVGNLRHAHDAMRVFLPSLEVRRGQFRSPLRCKAHTVERPDVARQMPGRIANASLPRIAVRTMTPRVPLHAVVKNHGPQLQKRAASPCVVELVLWYVPDAVERASTCRALHATMRIMRPPLQTTIMCCSDSSPEDGSTVGRQAVGELFCDKGGPV